MAYRCCFSLPMTPTTPPTTSPVYDLDGLPYVGPIKAYKPTARLITCHDLGHAERLNEANGFHWFKPDTMRCFQSRLGSQFPCAYNGTCGLVFISSEKCRLPGSPRLYSVRVVCEGGQIETFGPFNYWSKSGAVSVARRLVKQLNKGLTIADTEGNRFSL